MLHRWRWPRQGINQLRAALGLTLALGLTGCAYSVEVDITQPRLDSATAPLDGTHSLVQSFVCQHTNLYEIEVLPAIYESSGQGILTFALRTADGELASHSINASEVEHNIPLRVSFAPQHDSAGMPYELHIEGSPGVRVGFWYDSVNAYGVGELWLDGRRTEGDLRFTTRCQYDPLLMGRDVAASIRSLTDSHRSEAWWLAALAAVLLLPGYLLWYGSDLAKDHDPIVNLALSVALSLAVVPACLLWSTVLGLHWDPTTCLVTYGLLAAIAIVRLLQTRFADLAPWLAKHNRGTVLAVLALLGVTLLVRFAQVRGLVLPAWVDSPQHALVTELVAQLGQVPASYRPLLPVDHFAYHFGFHAATAVFRWLSSLPLSQAMLLFGQILNASSALMVYPLALRITRRRVGAVVAALLVGLVSYMPAYYVSWGRYTQLTGLLLLPAVMVTSIDWLGAERRNHRLLVLAALLFAGLALTHARVTIFGVCFVGAYLLCETCAHWRLRETARTWELWQRTGTLALLALVLSAPWAAQLLTQTIAALRATGQTLAGDPPYNLVPYALLFAPRNRELMIVAIVGAVWGLLQRRRETAWVLVWCALVALVVNPSWLGLPVTNLVNNATAVIALFLPLSVLAGQTAALVLEDGASAVATLGSRCRIPVCGPSTLRALLALLIGLAALWAGWEMTTIINPVTVLATGEDLEAMEWIRRNTPADARFLINVRHWQLGTFAGTDGGYWIRRLTGRDTVLPELPYVYGAPEAVKRVTAAAQVVSEVKVGGDPRLWKILRRERIGFIYLGAKGGTLTPQMFLSNPGFRPVYSSGAVWIFAVADSPTKKNG